MHKKKQPKQQEEAQPKPNTNDGGLVNFYEQDECKQFAVEYHNPNYDKENMPFKHPLCQILIGATGSGKSNILLNIIRVMGATFNYIRIFTQNKNEQLYEYLQSKIEPPLLEIYEGLDEMNTYLADCDKKLEDAQYLFIFDDFCIFSDKEQKPIENLYVRGRKMAKKHGISLIYLTQSYYDVPKIIRKQASQLILKKINGKMETNSIIRDCSSLEITKGQLQNMYNYCVKSKEDINNFMLIDKGADDKYRFRKNLTEILDPSHFV